MKNEKQTEHLTRHTIEQFQIEAGGAGDTETVKICEQALYAHVPYRQSARIEVAEMINDARAMAFLAANERAQARSAFAAASGM